MSKSSIIFEISQLGSGSNIDRDVIPEGKVAASVRKFESPAAEMPKSKTPPPLPRKLKAMQNNLSHVNVAASVRKFESPTAEMPKSKTPPLPPKPKAMQNNLSHVNVAPSVRKFESPAAEMPKSKTPPPLLPKPKAMQNNLPHVKVAASVRKFESPAAEMPKSKTPPPLSPKPKVVQNNLSQTCCNKGQNTPAFFRPISQNSQKDSRVETKNKNIHSNAFLERIAIFGEVKENLGQFGKRYLSALNYASSEETPPEKTSNNRDGKYYAKPVYVM